MFDELYQESLARAEHKVWILSDLQQGLPENTRRCLTAGISDFELLGRPAEQIWYLGDAVEGGEADRLIAMCRLQEEAFASLRIPLCYATGNHDYDYSRAYRDQLKLRVILTILFEHRTENVRGSKPRSLKRFEKKRSRMGHPCDQRDLGMLPQQAAFWIMGPECTACLFHRNVLMNLFWSVQIKRQAMRGWPITAFCALVGKASPSPFDHMINHVAARFIRKRFIL